MQKRWSIILGMLFLLAVGGAGGWLLLPRAVAAVPGAYQHYLPDPLLHLVATPLPTALPAPTAVADSREFIIPTLSLSTTTPTPTPNNQQSTENSQQETNSDSQPATRDPQRATFSPTPTFTPPPLTATPLPAAVRIEGLEIMPQKFNNCGPANLTINLNYYGHEADQLDVGGQIKPNYDDRNVSPWEMVDYVNQNTPLRAAAFVGGDVALLKKLLANGFPVIIEKGLLLSEWEGWMGHYLTLVGYDDAAQAFISLDTFLGPWDSSGRRDSYEDVADLWYHFNNSFILVYPPADEARLHAILGADLLDETTMWRETAVRAQRRTQSEPENAYAWFNLGSSLTQMGKHTGDATFYREAANAFDRARTIGLPWRMLWYQFDPYVAYLEVGRVEDVLTLIDAVLTSAGGQNVEETYLYRGYALQMAGETAAAEKAFTRAQNLNPNLTVGSE